MNNAWAAGSQADTAGFAELDAPILKGLEFNAAGRYDQYNTLAGNQFTPKFGVKYEPIDILALRGTWGKVFVRQVLPRPTPVSPSAPVRCLTPSSVRPRPTPTRLATFQRQCSVSLTGVQASNANLKPEKTTNWTLGTVIQPLQNVSLSLDYYDIKVTQDIISAFEAGGLGIPAGGLVRGPTATLPYCTADNVCRSRHPRPSA